MRRGGVRCHTQGAFDDFGFRPIVAADLIQPVLVARLVIDAVQSTGDAAGQGEADLRAEAGCQMQRILHRIAPAAAEVQHTQIGIDFLEIGNRRNDTVFQDFDGDHVLDADAHGVAGEALGVGHYDVVGGFAEGVAQSDDFGRSAAAAGGGVRLVRHEDGLRGHRVAVDAEATFGGRHQVLHDHLDVVDIQTRAVVGAVAGFAAQQFDDAAHTALAHRVFALDHQRAGAHAQDRAVAATIKGQRGLVNAVVGSGCSQRQESRANPLQQMITGDVVCAQDQHPAATAGAYPVFGDGNALGCAGTGRVDVGIGAAGTDVLGELAVAHGQDAEDKAAVKLVWLTLQRFAQVGDAPADLLQRTCVGGVAAQILQRGKLRAPVFPGVVAAQFLGEAVAAGEGAGEDDAGFIAHGVRQHPAIGQQTSGAGLAPCLHQRNACLAQRIDAGCKGKLSGDIQRFHQLGRHAVFLAQIERPAAACQLDHLIRVGDDLEAAAAVFCLDQAGDALVQHLAAETFRNQVHELLAAQDAQRVVRIHDGFIRARQAQAGAADDY